MNNRMALFLIKFILMATTLLTACSQAEPIAIATSESTTMSTLEPVPVIEITIWHTYDDASKNFTAFNTVLTQAAIDFPQYKIISLQVPAEDIYNKYITEVTTGDGPDILLGPNEYLGDYARAGLIANITIFAAGKLEGYNLLTVNSMILDGNLYGIPQTINTEVLWYNKKLLPSPPTTTDELRTLMENGIPVAISYVCNDYYGFFGSFNGKIFDENWNAIADQNAGVFDTISYLNELYQISNANEWPRNSDDGSIAFINGTVAAIIDSSQAMGDYRAALGKDLAVAPIPSGSGGPATPLLSADGFFFNPNSNHQQDAVDIALYLTSITSQTALVTDASQVPVRTDLPSITDPIIQDLLNTINAGVTIRPQEQQFTRYWSNFCDINPVFDGSLSASEWISIATANANK